MHHKFTPKEAAIFYALTLSYMTNRASGGGVSLVNTKLLLKKAGLSGNTEDIIETVARCLKTGRMRVSGTGLVFVKNSPNDFDNLPIDVRLKLQQNAMVMYLRKEENS